MFTFFYNHIAAHLKTMPPLGTITLQWIDLFNNQPNHPSDENPYTLPAVFVEVKIDWRINNHSDRVGEATVTLHIVQDMAGSDSYHALTPLANNSWRNAPNHSHALAQIDFVTTVEAHCNGFAANDGQQVFNELTLLRTTLDTDTTDIRVDTIEYTSLIAQATTPIAQQPINATIDDTNVIPDIVVTL